MTDTKQKNKHAQQMAKLSHEARLKKWGKDEYSKKMKEWSVKGVEARKKNQDKKLLDNHHVHSK